MLPRLPHELLERILLQLDPLGVKTCALLSREFNTFIRSSIALQCLLAFHTVGVVDNPRCKLSYSGYAERYEAREKAWCRLQPAFTKTIDVMHGFSAKFDLTAGIYLHAHINRRDLHYCTLPSTSNDVPRWTTSMISSPISCMCCHYLFDKTPFRISTPDRELTIWGVFRLKLFFSNSPRENTIRWLSILEFSCNTPVQACRILSCKLSAITLFS